MITSKSRYGLLFLVDLAENGDSGPIDLSSIASRQEIPEAYLAKLLAPLKSAGLLSSSRGAKGGYELARPPEEISLLEIVEALEGRASLVGVEVAGSVAPREGSTEERAMEVWKGLDRAVRDYLSGTTLAQAAGRRGIEYHI